MVLNVLRKNENPNIYAAPAVKGLKEVVSYRCWSPVATCLYIFYTHIIVPIESLINKLKNKAIYNDPRRSKTKAASGLTSRYTAYVPDKPI